MPRDLNEANFARALVDRALDRLGPDREAAFNQLFAGLAMGLSCAKILGLQTGNRTISFQDMSLLHVSSLREYEQEKAYGLPTDSGRWVVPSEFVFLPPSGKVSINPNDGSFEKSDLKPDSLLVTTLLDNVRGVCSQEKQVQRVCQMLTQASTVLLRMTAQSLHQHYYEHGPHTFTCEPLETGNVRVTIQSAPDYPLDGRIVVEVDPQGGYKFTDFHLAQR
jgi:hypothetical protein